MTRERVRVTAGSGRPGAPTRGIALPGTPVDDVEAAYARALRRSQLRLAVGTLLGFVVVMLALFGALTLIPELDQIVWFGVPLSWLLHAFGFYPAIAGFALLYVRGANRNERRYRALREEDER
ncbi:heavy metal transporter [Microbacterium sp. EYE_5]|uniref:heavy metal transporter n=1 Tax=unclassified Microbacterium TaxID=2609290 RepID=UPI0020060568|nr:MULTISPECIES: heavy metal transporter [unclassified Microbacterium]MCK6079728.1 heavy metal transporter [Microbacterium sp. EYE_382]MCK6084999.1 heavy metal transporter [Microbacterium sp. EYE_384]MCK6122775.1 heavy metal transporter [Microbacterium sp. EYE_80]MCK6125762.1 heavy metal transporter [Microbacterium sp. EYE_79]MCK6140683.1 heavy metal transporter [Microbacterium sp. EYE_39]